jgi:hypothetical protein
LQIYLFGFRHAPRIRRPIMVKYDPFFLIARSAGVIFMCVVGDSRAARSPAI